MTLFALSLTGFSFPPDLPNDKANFRFVVDVRYVSAGKDPQFLTKQAVLPGIDTFWECDESREGEPNYVRSPGEASFDFKLIDDWDKAILLLRATEVKALRFKVFDVNREGTWDKIKDVVGKLVEGILGKLGKLAPSGLPGFLTDALGSAEDEVQSYLLKKIAGGNDKVLYKGSAVKDFGTTPGTTSHTIKGRGTRGPYEIKFDLAIS